jgi:hypothetical protein
MNLPLGGEAVYTAVGCVQGSAPGTGQVANCPTFAVQHPDGISFRKDSPMTLLCQLLNAIFALLVTSFLAHAGESTADGGKDLVLERFTVARNGGMLLLPVTIQEKQYSFAVATTCPVTTFDTALGSPLFKATTTKPDGVEERTAYKLPQAKLGRLPLEGKGPFNVMDLTRFRELSGEKFDGIVGMDFLSRHIVQIDFDKGEFLILRALPPNVGSPFALTYDQEGLPQIAAQVEGLEEVSLYLDTTVTGCGSGRLSSELFAQLASRNKIDIVGSGLHATPSGPRKHRIGQARKLAVGDLAVVNPVFDESSFNNLGLNFLSRFVVTFDFPNSKIYLKKGKRYEDADDWNLSGLHVLQKMGKTVVDLVEKDSPAAVAGVKGGDRILKVGDKKTDGISLADFRRQCCMPGTLRLTLERDKKTVEVEVILKR